MAKKKLETKSRKPTKKTAKTQELEIAGKIDAKPKRRGWWKPGQSGNPAGRKPDKELAEARAIAAKMIGPYAKKLVKRLVDIALKSKSDSAAITASQELLNRLWGKPPQSLEVKGDGLQQQLVIAEVVVVDSPKEEK